jgi:rhodanese-related sulfurtransferase
MQLIKSGALAAGLLLAGSPACTSASAGADLDAPEAYRRLEAGELTLVDIRRPEEWRQTGVAKGALRIDMRRPDFAQALLQQVGGNRAAPIAIICRTGNRTTQLQRALAAEGFTQIFNVREGMAGSGAGPGWLRRGLPMEACTQC